MESNNTIKEMAKSFFPYAKKCLGFDKNPRVFFRNDSENAVNPLGKTAYYDPSNYHIVLYVSDRHPKDILRSVAHELVHHAQNCRGEFDGEMETGEGYAQTDAHLSKMEDEAYLVGNRLLRDYEDGMKTKNERIFETLVKRFTRR